MQFYRLAGPVVLDHRHDSREKKVGVRTKGALDCRRETMLRAIMLFNHYHYPATMVFPPVALLASLLKIPKIPAMRIPAMRIRNLSSCRDLG
jgi:hypothetical protein